MAIPQQGSLLCLQIIFASKRNILSGLAISWEITIFPDSGIYRKHWEFPGNKEQKSWDNKEQNIEYSISL